MLDGVVTGYEADFDFPERGGLPERPYLLASVPRSGSTYVSHVLWRTGCLGAPLEYLNFDPLGPYGFAENSTEEQDELWRAALRGRTSPNGVFGLKAFPIQLEVVQGQNPRLVAQVMRLLLGKGPASKVVQLRRRDRTAHAISYARAILSGIWRKEQEGEDRPEPEFSAEALEQAARLIDQQEGAWSAMYGDLGIAPLVLSYEEFVDDPAKEASKVADYLGVHLDPASAVAIPEIERQSQKGARAWADALAKE